MTQSKDTVFDYFYDRLKCNKSKTAILHNPRKYLPNQEKISEINTKKEEEEIKYDELG